MHKKIFSECGSEIRRKTYITFDVYKKKWILKDADAEFHVHHLVLQEVESTKLKLSVFN